MGTPDIEHYDELCKVLKDNRDMYLGTITLPIHIFDNGVHLSLPNGGSIVLLQSYRTWAYNQPEENL